MTANLDVPPAEDSVPLVVPGSPGSPDKASLRRRIRQERKARAEHEAARLAQDLADVADEVPELHRPVCVALYASMPGEPDTAALRERLRGRGVEVLLPVVRGGELGWAIDDGRLVAPPPGVPGGPQPSTAVRPPSALALAEVVLVPGLAVDTLGRRLGQGGGFYDRALVHVHPAALVAAVVHDSELLDAAVEPVPVEPHDFPVAAVLTPSRWRLLDPLLDLR